MDEMTRSCKELTEPFVSLPLVRASFLAVGKTCSGDKEVSRLLVKCAIIHA